MRYRDQTLDIGPHTLRLRTLWNTNQYADPDGRAEAAGVSEAQWPLFGVIWESSTVLARLMVDIDIEGKRILEVGCGTALASLVLAMRGADVLATDMHPMAEDFLKHNAALNDLPEIPFQRVDWTEPPDIGDFDLIVASELLYDRGAAASLAAFVDEHARPVSQVILVDPGRGQAGRFQRDLEERGFRSTSRHAYQDEERFGGFDELDQRIQIYEFRSEGERD